MGLSGWRARLTLQLDHMLD
nr:unnamed protein product [Callosobruchus chinensis]